MRRLKRGERLVVASHNPGKVWEINKLLEPYGLDAVSAGDLGFDVPEEPEPTFRGNARLKAIYSAGDTEDPMALYRAFRGRDPAIAPLLEQRGLAA